METLDDILRYGAVALLGWIAVLMWRNFCDRLAGQLGALSALSSISYLISTKAGFTVFGMDGALVFLPISSISAIVTWLFCLSQFDDNFRIELVHKAVFALKVIAGLAIYPAIAMGEAQIVIQLAAFSRLIILGVVIHLIVVTWQGRHDDLVEERRKFRSIFTISVVAVSFAILFTESYLTGHNAAQYLLVVQAFGFWAIAVFLLWRLSSPNSVDLFFSEVPTADEVHSEKHCELSATDQHDLDTVIAFTKTEGVFESGLTIAKLAHQIHIPEHRLRHLINQHMGFRNFADFLNHHRVGAAKHRLANTSERHTPVLTIAMDTGYGSLGPFNRAFKERTGLTPTEFRAQSMEAELVAAK